MPPNLIIVASRFGGLGLRVDLHLDALLLPDFDLPVFRFLPSLLLILFDRQRSLAMRGSSQRMPDLRPEVEDSGMGHDLRENQSEQVDPQIYNLRTLLSQKPTELVSHLKRT